jgi:hypothetical protein
MKKNIHKKGAAILIVVLFFVILSTTILVGISMPIVQQIENASDFLTSNKGYTAADAQAENALYRFNKGRSDAPSVLSVLGSDASASITDVGNEKQISILGIAGEFERYIQARFKQDVGVAFNYGLQTGVGGLQMEGSSYIVGNVYSNGDITGAGGSGWYNSYISGSATAATISNPISYIENLSAETPTHTQNVGLTNTNQDFAQSFVMSTTSPITDIQIYMKKTGSPANATVKIVNNNAGSPGTTVLTSGVLSASLVTSLYAYVPISMTTNVPLISGATYWLVIDVASNNTTSYYTVGMNNGIFSGNTKQGRLSSSWSNLTTTTADAGFKVLVGGDPGVISGIGVGTSGTGDAWAKTVNNTTVTGTIYCQNGTGNNKACNTSRADPVASPMPISSGNVDEWKVQAEAGGATSSVTIGGANTRTLGPIKINGNLNVEGSGRLNITGPIYVTGFIKVQGAGRIYVDSSMGDTSGIIVADGVVNLEGSGGIYGSGAAGSYVVVATNSTCPGGANCASGSSYALKVSGAAGSVVLTALDGSVELEGSVSIKSLAAKKVKMSGTSNIRYESGLADLNFTSGPSGSWTVSSWKESLGL